MFVVGMIKPICAGVGRKSGEGHLSIWDRGEIEAEGGEYSEFP
jgi:hypothetical protein